MTTLEDVQRNGGWLIAPAPPSSSITFEPLPPGKLLQQIDGWTTVVGGAGRGQRWQQALITSLDSVAQYYHWTDDGDYVNTAEAGPSDPPYVPEWQPHGSPSPVANRHPLPASDHRTSAGR